MYHCSTAPMSLHIANGQHDTTHFNGYPNQYVAHPLQVTVGQRVRFRVLDAGVAVPLSFHIVGGQFDTVFKEGAYLLQPGNELSGGSQALGLMAAEGGSSNSSSPRPAPIPSSTTSWWRPSAGLRGRSSSQNE